MSSDCCTYAATYDTQGRVKAAFREHLMEDRCDIGVALEDGKWYENIVVDILCFVSNKPSGFEFQKYCTTCPNVGRSHLRPCTAFGSDNRKDGLAPYCKDCYNEVWIARVLAF